MTEFKATESHCHPAFCVCWEEYQRTVLDNLFKVGFEEFKDKIKIRFRRKDVEELMQELTNISPWNGTWGAHLDDILMLQLPQIFNFTDSRHIQTILEQTDFDLFDGDFAPCRSLTP